MKEQTLRNCELLIENRNRVKSVFRWDGGLLHLACAGINGTISLIVAQEAAMYAAVAASSAAAASASSSH